jgi:glutamyl endopeptidase
MTGDHRSRSSEESPREAAEAEPVAPTPLETRIEDVPGYRPRGLAESAESAAVVVDRAAVVDAAQAGFRKVDTVEVVIGDDDRRPVPDPTQSPWRHNCALRIKTKTNRNYVGTGWFIGPRTVMTAGHCVYIHDEGGWAQSIEVIPALDGDRKPFDSSRSSRFRAVDGWIERADSDFDYAAILLDDPLGEKTGWYGFAALDAATLQSADLNITGYPADRDRATRQYFHARRITRVTPRKIYYEIDTYGGQSGSCDYLLANGNRVAVGIHTTGAAAANSGTLINQDVFENMRRWKQGA